MKKKKKMNRKKKIILISSIAVILFILLIVLLKVRQENKEINNINEATTLKQVIEFCECKYISSKESDAENYKMDIYMEFKYNPYEENQSKQPFYDVTIQAIESFLKYRNIRLIDESRNLVIRVETNSTSITKKYFNDLEESEYFNKLLSEANLEEGETLKETSFNINSELQTLVENGWKEDNINFGNKTSTFRDYDIYFDEGYRVRTIRGQIYNIVFTDRFEKEVINNIKVGDELGEIKDQLGENYIEKDGILEYMGKDLYVCFSNDEISIYPRISYDYTSFEKILEQYNEDHNFNNFMNKLTNIWPDYSSYYYDTSYCKIYYPLKGVKIDNSTNALNGIQIFQEYQGNLKNEHKDYYQLYYKTNDSLIIEAEHNRRLEKAEIPDSTDVIISSKFVRKAEVNDMGQLYDIAFFSVDGDAPDSELGRDIYVDKCLWYDDENFIYSIKKKGIYMYNCRTRETKTIVSGSDEYAISNFDYNNKILTYDGKDLKIEN